MISDGERCVAKSQGRQQPHYLAIKKIPALLRRINIMVTFNVRIPFFLFKQKRLETQKRVFKNKDFCNIIMPSEDAKTLEFNLYKNLIKHQL